MCSCSFLLFFPDVHEDQNYIAELRSECYAQGECMASKLQAYLASMQKISGCMAARQSFVGGVECHLSLDENLYQLSLPSMLQSLHQYPYTEITIQSEEAVQGIIARKGPCPH